MNITLTITADAEVDRDVLAKLYSTLLSGCGPVPPASLTVRSTVAPPIPKIESIPAPPLDPATKARLEELEAKHAAPAEEPEAVKRGRGRPPGSKNKPKSNEPPVPRPDGGLYGFQKAPEGDAAWQEVRQIARRRLGAVNEALIRHGFDYQKYMDRLLKKYGDNGMLSTVPQGNLEALVEEAEIGPKEHPLTREELDAAAAVLAKKVAQ